MSDSLQPHGLQHAKHPCPSPTSIACSNSSIKLVMTSNYLNPLLPASLPTISLSQHQGLFKWVSSSYQVAKALKFQLQHQSFQWKFRTMISLRIDSFDLVAAQGTLKSLLQHHSSKASILQCSPFLIVQLSQPYMRLLLLSHFTHVRLCATP